MYCHYLTVASGSVLPERHSGMEADLVTVYGFNGKRRIHLGHFVVVAQRWLYTFHDKTATLDPVLAFGSVKGDYDLNLHSKAVKCVYWLNLCCLQFRPLSRHLTELQDKESEKLVKDSLSCITSEQVPFALVLSFYSLKKLLHSNMMKVWRHMRACSYNRVS